MSKKTLKDGLESLFGKPLPSVEEETAFMGDNVLPEGKRSNDASQRKNTQKKASDSRSRSGSSVKSFTADLESLFQTVVKESVVEERKKAARQKKRTIGTPQSDMSATQSTRSPMGGLDSLIRRTVEPNKEEIQRAVIPKEKKRVTFVFDKKKLLKLKTIAKLEKAYLKDIIGGLISGYLEEYEIDKKTSSESSK